MLKLLEGIKILDLTRLLPGPLCTLYLAELGAEVIKIEPPEGDYVRYIPPKAKKNSYIFLQLNHNKKNKTFDLKDPEHRKEFLALVKDAQVVVESFRPGVTKSLGIDFEALKNINPSLVYCSITGYGQSGPYRDFAGHDINYLATSGILEQMGNLANFQIADLAGGSLSACVGILAALLDSQKNKRAHFIDVSMLDCVMGLNHVALAGYQSGRIDIPLGEDLLSGGFPFYGLFTTKDGRQFALGALEVKFWKNFCEATNKTEWIKWHSEPQRNYPRFKSEIAGLFLTRTMREWEDLLKDKECCGSSVLKFSEALMDPQVKSRQMLKEHQTPEDGPFKSYKFPIIIE
ncbi:MAG TPA: CoA transferase [Bacteriovoracaceae bacterium]|nr:CoA transferase [Bacteriovoracaceae bacterium]